MAELSRLRQALTAAEAEREEARAACSALRAEQALLSLSLEQACEALEQAEAAREDMQRELEAALASRETAELALAAAQAQLFVAQNKLEENHTRLQSLAYHDGLTGLPNDLLLEETVSDYVSLLAPMWLFRVKLHRMDRIRDTMGHHIGDEYLRRMTARLRKVAASALMIARTDRDSFAIVTTPEATPNPQAFAEAVISSFSHTCTIGAWTHRPRIHIGYAAFPEDAVAWSLLEKKVGTALVVAERTGASAALRWRQQMDEAVQEAMLMELNLQQALQRGEIFPFYQPIVEAGSGQVRGFEALMRWRSPDHGMVAPERFIPILEETGMIVPFGEWMLRTCCAQNMVWQQMTGKPTVISINVSTIQIRRGRFPETVSRVLRETGMPPETLELEVTESVLLDDVSRTIEDLQAIRDLGCLLSMDDFGTGYSSLSYLRKLPIHTLKIDKSFVDDLARLLHVSNPPREAEHADNPEQRQQSLSAQRMIGSIISLAHDLQLEVVAEGVETIEQQKTLLQSSCDLLQGFIFHRPMSAEEATEVLRLPLQR